MLLVVSMRELLVQAMSIHGQGLLGIQSHCQRSQFAELKDLLDAIDLFVFTEDWYTGTEIVGTAALSNVLDYVD